MLIPCTHNGCESPLRLTVVQNLGQSTKERGKPIANDSGTSLLVIAVKNKISTLVSSWFVRLYVHHSLGLGSIV